MANTTRNFLTHNYSGRVGKQYVLKTRGEKSIIASRPTKAADAVTSAKQLALRKSFKLAVIYARKAVANDTLKAEYAAVSRGNQSAFNVAFMDAYKGPELADLRTDGYKGAAGQPIIVQATDNFRVSGVKFSLHAADGTLLEEGAAVEDENGYDWIYTTQVANPSLPGTIIQVKALDVPKNEALLEARL